MKSASRLVATFALFFTVLSGCGEDTSIPQIVPVPDAFQPPTFDGGAEPDLGVAIDAMISPDLGMPQDPCSDNDDCQVCVQKKE